MKLIMKKNFNWFAFILMLCFGLFLFSFLLEMEFAFTLFIFLPVILCLLIARITMDRRKKTQPGNMHTKKRDIIVMIIVLIVAEICLLLSTFRAFFNSPNKNEIGVGLLYGPSILLFMAGILLIILRMKKNP